MKKHTKYLVTHMFMVQVLVTVALWLCLFALNCLMLNWFGSSVPPMVIIIAVPAIVISVSQLALSTHIQKAAYIKDYAIRLRTDKELSESYHYLVYKFGNDLYRIYNKSASERLPDESKMLQDAQTDVAADLRFFDFNCPGTKQERRFDNLLGFFDTIGYDYDCGLLRIDDIAGVFGYYLQDFAQREVVQEYFKAIEKWPELYQKNWPAKYQQKYQISPDKKYYSSIPFYYLKKLIDEYVKYQRDRPVVH